MLKKLPALFAGLLVALTAFAVSESELRNGHPDTYTVKRGDTLWDISARFLKKPWLWPEIWQANPQVENPHLIYPGDVLNLSYLNNGGARLTGGGPRVRREPLEDAIQPISLKDIEQFLKNMRVVDENTFKGLPHIVAVEENKLRAVNGNLAYVRGLDAKPGDAFVIVRPTHLYYSVEGKKGNPPTTHARVLDTTHGQNKMLWHNNPVKNMFGRNSSILGYEVQVIANAQVTRTGDPSSLLITYSDYEIRPGDLIMPIEDRPYDSQYFPHAPKSVPTSFEVLAFTDALNAIGPKQVVALSRGSADGIENGQTFSIYHPGERITDQYKYPEGGARNFFNPNDSKVTLPAEYIGHVMIFRTFDRVSYGLVMDGLRPVHLHDVLTAPE
ncbi:MAG TPA: LysM domain-containing protein [Tahibacter sp.]|uniref:LysM peptidoglycan-binding domain-containing protein n=1 Tax=Tahibacter sp. TaxID=2056211 RepID=UPI002C9BB1F7|nr:LysM domain-containing protein [Tahibacter sp.]HSX59476.1 LysM domain-containing protein [Tahibacter sp.]